MSEDVNGNDPNTTSGGGSTTDPATNSGWTDPATGVTYTYRYEYLPDGSWAVVDQNNNIVSEGSAGTTPTGSYTTPGGTSVTPSTSSNTAGSTLGNILGNTNLNGLLSGLTSAGTSALGSYYQYKAAEDALSNQQSQFNTTQTNMKPWLDAGTNALGAQQTLANQASPTLNLPTAPTLGTFSYDPSTALNDPFYQAMQTAGQQAVDASAAKNGSFGSGNQASALYNQGMSTMGQFENQDYSQSIQTYNTGVNQLMQQYGLSYDQALQMYNSQVAANTNKFNQQASISGTGQTTANQLGDIGQSYANAAGANTTAAGNALSTGITNAGTQLANTLKTSAG